jgi:hypothetical protein
MKLNGESIKEYQEIYFLEYGVSLNEEDAEMQANQLFVFMRNIFNTDRSGN